MISGQKRQSGFTLVEMSVVLVIVGLLAGAVLAGRDLIVLSERRRTIQQVDKLRLMIQTFRIKYNCLPGDCSNASALFSGTTDGNGDGVYNNTAFWYIEPNKAIEHLRSSGLWDFPPGSGTYYEIFLDLPKPGFAYLYTYDIYPTSFAPFLPNSARSTNFISTGAYTTAPGSSINGSVHKAADARWIDLKIDDGRSLSGKVFGRGGTIPGGGGTLAPSCQDAGLEYDHDNPDSRCRMFFAF